MAEETKVRSQKSEGRRRFRRIHIPCTNAIGLLDGSLRLSLPERTVIVAALPADTIYPIGVALLLYHDDFAIVPDYEEVPYAPPGFYAYEEVSTDLPGQLEKVRSLLDDAVRSRKDDHNLELLMEARARVTYLTAGDDYDPIDEEKERA